MRADAGTFVSAIPGTNGCPSSLPVLLPAAVGDCDCVHVSPRICGAVRVGAVGATNADVELRVV